jgi:RecA/RadA recombinase
VAWLDAVLSIPLQAFSAERLVEIARSHLGATSEDDPAIWTVVDCVHVISADTTSALQTALAGLKERVLRLKAKLVVVDSIASLVRKEFDGSSQLPHMILVEPFEDVSDFFLAVTL